MPRRFFAFALFLLLASSATAQRAARFSQPTPAQPQTTQVNHVFWIWFENRETTDITAATAPTFDNFANTYARLTNFFGISHPSQPNYIDAAAGSNMGVTDDNVHTFAANGDDNLARQLATAGKSWRAYMQGYPGSCSNIANTSTAPTDGPGLAGDYFRKHNQVISFESIRLDPTQCANIQPLANFDPSVNFAFIAPNIINDMHDGATTQAKITQGDNFLNAFLPQITGAPDWAHTMVIVTFDEGTTNTNGGGHIYTAVGAPWLSHATSATQYNHFSMLRTIESIFGLTFLGSAATATTISEILPAVTTAAQVSFSGRVLNSGGFGIRNARVTLRDANGNARFAVTNAFGYYSFDGVASGANYIVTAAARGSVFTPRSVTVTDQLTSLDLIAQ
ncbi:MAG: carboxypeptidase regulatory-like domain-containing protein [Acidobacteria bacterium]|nr:carboxypeptidase regulatory-like domain-containing protein [Acidobacteriota bacterium]